MTELKAKVILTDIEGTTTSISFVKDILFPYAKLHTKSYLNETWNDDNTKDLIGQLQSLPQYQEFLSIQPKSVSPNKTESGAVAAELENITNFVNYLIEKDLKVGPLKTLQGLVWAKGYGNGSIKGHVYCDVDAAFKRWHDAGIRIAIYSSGSVRAQQLLFGQTVVGDLLPFISEHYDTAVGHKQEKESYVSIAQNLGVEAGDVVFLTDIVKEAEAARLAGMETVILSRPGNAPLTDDDKIAFSIVDSFDNLKITTN